MYFFFLQNTLLYTTAKRNYSMPMPLSFDYIKNRVILVLQLYDKIDPEKVYIYVNFRLRHIRC